jgi:hypothetical protein
MVNNLSGEPEKMENKKRILKKEEDAAVSQAVDVVMIIKETGDSSDIIFEVAWAGPKGFIQKPLSEAEAVQRVSGELRQCQATAN